MGDYLKRLTLALIFVIPLLLLSAHCGGDTEEYPDDGGVSDAAHDSSTPDGGQADGSQSDAQHSDGGGYDGGTDPTEDGTCTNDLQCAEWPWGTKCIDGYCLCSDSAHCASSDYGHMCDTSFSEDGSYGICECAGDDDCPSNLPRCGEGYLSDGTPVSVCWECMAKEDCSEGMVCDPMSGTCVEACESADDCAGNEYYPVCDITSGECVECIANGDCKGDLPFCGQTGDNKNVCVGCVDNANCTAMYKHLKACVNNECRECGNTAKDSAECLDSPNGPHCASNRCGCDKDDACKKPSTWGYKCADGICGCKRTDECINSNFGKICDLRYNTCGCTMQSECVQTDHLHCETLENQMCVGCVKDAHCTGRVCKSYGWGLWGGYTCVETCDRGTDPNANCQYDGIFKICDTLDGSDTEGHCLQCKSDTDCADDANGLLKCHKKLDPEEGIPPVYGKCVQCLKASETVDCPASDYGPHAKCDEETLTCVECTEDTDCAESEYGLKCVGGYCGCETNTDCPTGQECFFGMCFSMEE